MSLCKFYNDYHNDQEKKPKYEPPVPSRVGKKKKVQKGPDAAHKLPAITPHAKCRLRLLKLERVKDFLLMEEEFIRNQEVLKPQEERNEVNIFHAYHQNYFPLLLL